AFAIDLAAVEFIDRRTIAALNRFRHYGLEELPTLFLEADGSETGAAEAARAALDVCAEHGGSEVRLADGQSAWEGRHWRPRSIRATNPGTEIVRTDLAVPLSRLPEVVDESYRRGDAAGVRLYAFGHAGLGIVHVLIAESPAEADRWKAALRVKDEIL